MLDANLNFCCIVYALAILCLAGCRYNVFEKRTPQNGVVNEGCRGYYKSCEKAIVPWLSAKDAVEIYASHYESAPFFDGLCPDSRIVFVDLDFDGVLEALAITTEGTSRNTMYKAYRIDPHTRRVVALIRTGDRGADYDYEWRAGHVCLVADKKTGQRRYSVDAFACESSRMLAYSKEMGHVFMDKGQLRTVDIAGVVNYRDKDDDPYLHEYWFEKKQMDENTYRKKLSGLQEQYCDLNVCIGEICYWHVEWCQPEKLRRLMMDAYIRFRYDGFSFKSKDWCSRNCM